MTNIMCNVCSCSNNKDGNCYASCVNIGGKGVTNEGGTCCGSYLNKAAYSNLSQYTCQRGENETVSCMSNSCKYNSSGMCSLEKIDVGGNAEAKIYTETQCLSFQDK